MAKTTTNPADFLLNGGKQAPEPEAHAIPEAKPQATTTHPTKDGVARSKKVLVAMTPAVYADAKARADKQSISFNEYINNLIKTDVYGKNGI